MYDHLNAGWGYVEEPPGFNDLQPLVHHRSRIDRDLWAHRPIRVLQCGLRADRIKLIDRRIAKWSTRSREDNLLDASEIFTRQALVYCAVLAVNREEYRTSRSGHPAYDFAGDNQGLLVGKGDALPLFDCGHCGRKACKPHESAYHDVDRIVPTHIDQTLRSGQDLDFTTKASTNQVDQRLVPNHNPRRGKLLNLPGKQIESSVRRESSHRISITMSPDDIQCLRSD